MPAWPAYLAHFVERGEGLNDEIDAGGRDVRVLNADKLSDTPHQVHTSDVVMLLTQVVLERRRKMTSQRSRNPANMRT